MELVLPLLIMVICRQSVLPLLSPLYPPPPPSKIRAASRRVPGVVWLFPKRERRAKLFVLFLDQSGYESDYSPTAGGLCGRTRELASAGSGISPRRAHARFHHHLPHSR